MFKHRQNLFVLCRGPILVLYRKPLNNILSPCVCLCHWERSQQAHPIGRGTLVLYEPGASGYNPTPLTGDPFNEGSCSVEQAVD